MACVGETWTSDNWVVLLLKDLGKLVVSIMNYKALFRHLGFAWHS